LGIIGVDFFVPDQPQVRYGKIDQLFISFEDYDSEMNRLMKITRWISLLFTIISTYCWGN